MTLFQWQSQSQKMEQITEELRQLKEELTKALSDASAKERELIAIKKKLEKFEKAAKSKEFQINIFAVMYMTLFEELKAKKEDELLKEEEKRNLVADLSYKLIEMTNNFIAKQTESDKIEKEIEILNSCYKLKNEKIKQVN